MTAPTKNFTAVLDSAIDSLSGHTTTTWTALRDRLEHIEEWLGASYTAAQAHVHDGTDSALVEMQTSWNLLMDAGIQDHGNYKDAWSQSGITFTRHDGAIFQTSGNYLYQTHWPNGAWGTNGADMVVSVFVRSQTELTSGTLKVGMSDNSTSTFLTNGSMSISYTSITTNWQRFWCALSDIGGSATDLRYLVRCSSSFSHPIFVACYGLHMGTRLAPWTPAPMSLDRGAGGTFDRNNHFHYLGLPGNVPMFDYEVSMDNAVKVAAS